MVQVSVGGSRQLQSAEADVRTTPRHPATCTRPRSRRAGGKLGTATHGSTTALDTLGNGMTENVSMMRSGLSSRVLEIKSVPKPAPVPIPREWHNWKPWMQSQPLRLHPHHIRHRVDELCTLGGVSLRPTVACAGLPQHKVVWPEQLSERSRTDAVHGSQLKVHENREGHVAATSGLIVVHVDTLKLEVRVTVVRARGVDAVLIRDDLPELGPDLIATLTTLDVDELAHGFQAKELVICLPMMSGTRTLAWTT